MQFKANLILTVLAIMVFALLLNLGFWQLDRANEKQALLDLQAKRITLKPIDLHEVNLQKNDLRYLPVSVAGAVDTAQQILIDNQIKHGQVGYLVMTPLRLTNGIAILLNRGWLPQGNDLSLLPNISLDVDRLQLTGKLDHFPSVGIKLKGADQLSEGWPAVVQVIDVDKVSERLGYRIAPYQVLLDSLDSHGFDREWVPLKMGPEKHHGYAFQWFSLSVAWVIIYFVLTVKRREK